MRPFSSDTSSANVHRTRTARKAHSRCAVIAMSAIAAAMAVAPAGAQVDDTLAAQVEADRAAAASQQEINTLKDRTLDAASRYAQAMAEADSLEQYNVQLSAQVQSQEDEIASIEQQLLDIETTNREVQPLMDEMVATLEQFVLLDVPFLLSERIGRVESLKNMMARADVTISEKYRRILEAYQIELEYGRTLDAFEGRLIAGEDVRTVEFVRLGRISLMYQTLDGAETGYWDAQQKKWIVDPAYADAVEQALRVAKQEGAPELLTVPVPAPQETKS